MLIISSRENFNDPDKLKTDGHGYKEIDLQTDKVVRVLSEDQLLNEIAGKYILFLIHGYNNEQNEVYDAYSIIEEKIAEHTGGAYDLVIGYSWPGGDKGIEWWTSKSRANAVARRFRFLIESMSSKAKKIDVMTHSLGARVLLKALKQANGTRIIRNYFCTAAAVDNEVLEKGEEFHLSVKKSKSIFVFHSKEDGVLATAYRLGEWDNALGLYGPEDKAYIESRTKTIFVANCKKVVKSHGSYKRCDAMYKYITKVIIQKPTKFVTLR